MKPSNRLANWISSIISGVLLVIVCFFAFQYNQLSHAIRWYEVLDDSDISFIREHDFSHMDEIVLLDDPKGYLEREELIFFPESEMKVFSTSYEDGVVKLTYRISADRFLLLDGDTRTRGQIFANPGSTVEIENYDQETKELTYYVCETHFSIRCTSRLFMEGEDIEGFVASTKIERLTLSHNP